MANERHLGDASEMPRDPRHEELCAYVLGECDAETRARVESELAKDPELRAEKEQLERTIGAVQSAVAAGAEPAIDMAMPQAASRGPWVGWGVGLTAAAAASVAIWFGSQTEEADVPVEARGEEIADLQDVDPAGLNGLGNRNETTDLDAPTAGDMLESDIERLDTLGREVVRQEAAKTPATKPVADFDVQVAQGATSTAGGTYRGPGDAIPPQKKPSGTNVATVSPSLHFKYPLSGNAGGGGGAPVDNRNVLFALGGQPQVTDLNAFGVSPNGLSPDQILGALTRFERHESYVAGLTILGEEPNYAGGLAPGGFDVFHVGSGTGKDGAIALPRITPADIDAFLKSCHARTNERPRDMYFRFWGDNAFVITRQDALATFAADVDTASFVLARRYLRDGHLPEKAQIRTEEFVNYFDPDLPAPTENDLAIHVEAVKSPFGGSETRYLLRVGIRAKEIPREERDPLVVTFVVDNSGSMKEDNRIELVRHALRTLTAQLDERDQIGIVAFNGEARLVLPITNCGNKESILKAIDQLNANGSTNAEAGLMLGYELASRALPTSGESHHRVVLLSDGVANVGDTDQNNILKKVEGYRLEGIHLNTVGVGMDNHNDVFLEQLANGGDGMCDYVDDARSVHQALVERFTGAFQPVAADVKIQVEFTGDRVLRWRQLGYENRVVADEDFRNDAVDAGEIGSGHQVTALFEIEDSGVTFGESDWAKVRVRWMPPRRPGGSETPREAQEIETVIDMDALAKDFPSASPGFQRAALVAQFAEVLRRSTHARGDSWDQLVKETTRVVTLPEFVQDAETAELVTMLQAADRLGLDEEMEISPLAEAVDEYRRHHYLKHQLECMEEKLAQAEIDELKRQNDRLEARIRGLLQGR